jgi:hypothetical protein
MKRFAVALALGMFAMASAALAQNMPNNDSNTFVVTEANGTVLRYHFNSDGTWDALTPDGQTVSGTYTATADQICLTAAGAAQPTCAENHPDKRVGDTWTQAGTDGSQISVSLVAGRP